MCLFFSVLLKQSEMWIYVLESGVCLIPFLSHLQKVVGKKEIKMQCLNSFSPVFEKGFSHLLTVVGAFKDDVVCVTSSVPRSDCGSVGWGLK